MRDRSTGELLVLLIASTVCAVVLISLLFVGILEAVDSTIDTSRAQGTISDIINTLIGLMAGFLAGKTERVQRQQKEEGV